MVVIINDDQFTAIVMVLINATVEADCCDAWSYSNVKNM